jgi:Hydroxyethylthiazole kinase, sugar kinase family
LRASPEALTFYIGTLNGQSLTGMPVAASVARASGRPWAIDPVAVFASTFCGEACARLLAEKPAAIRGNASEIRALAGEEAGGRGVDAGDPVEAAEAAARALAARTGAVVAATGETDFVTDGARSAQVAGGHPLMTRVTAMGCGLTAVLGAYLAAVADPFEATVAALAHFKLAGERAGADAAGPGSFHPAFLDALAAIDGPALAAGARVTA